MDLGETIRRVKDATDMVALVQRTVKLRKAGGGGWMGACPLHGGTGKTPSLSILPERGTFHCFGCGKKGDAIAWVMETQGMDFRSSLELLAKEAGIELPQPKDAYEPEGPEARMMAALEAAQAFYEDQLWRTAKARDYLIDTRRLEEPTIQQEGLGYAPGGWDATVEHLKRQGFGAELILQAGIASRSERGTLIDFLRNRITIPIRDPRGRIVAFGGRLLDGEGPKYLNSRETPIFRKEETLFGLSYAKGFLRDGAVIVEGYFDAIALHQAGVSVAVAPMGTALTEAHLKTLKRWTTRVTLAFDGDGAGHRAMEKALALALPQGFDVRMLEVPEGEDPDTWAMKLGPEGLKRVINDAPDWARFRLAESVRGRDLRRISDRLAAAQEVAGWLLYLPKERRLEVATLAAHELKVPVADLRRLTQEAQKIQGKAVQPILNQTAALLPVEETIQSLLAMAARGPEAREWVAKLPRSWWEDRAGSGVLMTFLDGNGDEEAMPEAEVAALHAAITAAALKAQPDHHRIAVRLEREYLQREMRHTLGLITNHATPADIATTMEKSLLGYRMRLAQLSRPEHTHA